nr:copper amine oxidase N-terminal domain-containing protein [Desulforadius tongensis]
MVPYREIFESLGARVWYDEDTNSAMGQKDDTTIKLSINQDVAFINDREVCLDVASQVVNGRIK